jgi:hypothetical protein
MPHAISLGKMSTLSMHEGTIGIEGECEDTEMVVRIPMSQEAASDLYYKLGNMW